MFTFWDWSLLKCTLLFSSYNNIRKKLCSLHHFIVVRPIKSMAFLLVSKIIIKVTYLELSHELK